MMISVNWLILFFLVLHINQLLSQPSLEWAREYNFFGSDAALSISLDDSGSVYVTGSSEAVGATRDVATLKYIANGTQQWVTRFNGTENGDDFGWGLVFDKSGHLYSGGGYLIKYNRYNGSILWTRRFIGIGSGGRHLNIDSNEFIYSSGISINSFATIKYDTSGNVQWTRLLNGTGGGANFMYAQSIDRLNNIIVTGRIKYSNITFDYAAVTVKYLPSGDTLWVKHYDNPDTLRPSDESRSCTIDDSGNVYITGYARAGNGIVGDCLIIKYKPNGDSAWTRFYGDGFNGESGEDIDVDRFGNVYVAVRINDIFNGIIKYNSDGVFQWIRTHPVFGFGAFPLVKLDHSGNVYISSSVERNSFSDLRITKYNSAGDEIWFVIYPGSGNNVYYSVYDMIIDKWNNVYATGSTSSNYITVKYSQLTGVLQMSNETPSSFQLHQNYPNPFNPVTNLKFGIPVSGFVTLKVYDVLGNEVATLINEMKNAGSYNYQLLASRSGSIVNYQLSSGIYFYSLSVDGILIDTKRMIFLK